MMYTVLADMIKDGNPYVLSEQQVYQNGQPLGIARGQKCRLDAVNSFLDILPESPTRFVPKDNNSLTYDFLIVLTDKAIGELRRSIDYKRLLPSYLFEGAYYANNAAASQELEKEQHDQYYGSLDKNIHNSGTQKFGGLDTLSIAR